MNKTARSEEQHSNNLRYNWVYRHNSLFDSLCESILSTANTLGCRSDNRLISTCWNPYRFFRKRETNHSERINEAYTELKKITVDEDENHKVSLKVLNKQFEDIKYFSQVLLHLKSYKQIYKNWKSLSTLEDDVNGILDEIESMQKKLIREKARHFQNYPNHIAVLEKPTSKQKGHDCYNMIGLTNDIYNYLYQDESQGMLLSDYIYHEKHLGDTYLLTNDSNAIMIESKNELDSKHEKLIILLESVLVDKELRKKYTDLRKTRMELDRTIKKFSDEIRELSEDIDLGHIIKGKCRLGY